MKGLRETLKQELNDPDYRYAYAESSLNTRIASQIKVLREQRGETQDTIAQQCGTKQAGFSRFEDVNHSVWKTDTLWKIARALGVRLHVSFETFGSLIEDREKFSREYLQRPKFDDDPILSDRPAETDAMAKAVNVLGNQPGLYIVPKAGAPTQNGGAKCRSRIKRSSQTKETDRGTRRKQVRTETESRTASNGLQSGGSIPFPLAIKAR